MAPRAVSDEAYVLSLCDEILGERGQRQQRFVWLRGDPGPTGRRASLPVDAFYPSHALVVAYHERQHDEAVERFDRRQTVSGVSRGEQRRRYDERRRIEVPAHGLTLVVVSASDLDADSRGRLRRSRAHDLTVLRERLAKYTRADE